MPTPSKRTRYKAAHAQRITNGQRACVCGLVIAGFSYIAACKIAGVPHRSLRAILPAGWHTRTAPHRRWRGELLAEVKEARCDRAQIIDTVAARYGVSASMIYHLAVEHGWPQRKRGPKRKPTATRAMTSKQLHRYNKMRPILGRNAALAHVFGDAR